MSTSRDAASTKAVAGSIEPRPTIITEPPDSVAYKKPYASKPLAHKEVNLFI